MGGHEGPLGEPVPGVVVVGSCRQDHGSGINVKKKLFFFVADDKAK